MSAPEPDFFPVKVCITFALIRNRDIEHFRFTNFKDLPQWNPKFQMRLLAFRIFFNVHFTSSFTNLRAETLANETKNFVFYVRDDLHVYASAG